MRKLLNIGKFYRSVLFLYIAIVCLLPVYHYQIIIEGISIEIIYIFLFLLVALCMPLSSYHINNHVSRKVFINFNVIIIIAGFSIAINEQLIGKFNEYYSLFVTWCNMTFAYLTSKVIMFKTIDLKKTISMLSLLLTTVIFFYILWWIFFYHMETRLTGLIGASSVLYLPMVLLLSIHLSNITTKSNRLSSIIGSFIAIAGILLTNSRAGLITLVLLLLFFLFKKISVRKLVLGAVIILISIAFVSKFSSLDRLKSFESLAREENIKTSLQISTSSFKNFIFGTGYGDVWQFGSKSPDAGFIGTAYGMLLHHPHSTFLKIFVELGAVGLLLIIFILGVIAKEFYGSIKRNNAHRSYILFAVLCTSAVSFSTDLFLFQNWHISLLWWLFLFLGLLYPEEKKLTKQQS